MTRVINLFAGPSAGKTTNAAELFGYMKKKRMNVEYAPEFAKDLAFNKSQEIDDQILVFGAQHQRLYTLFKNVDYVITDSPLFLSLYYVRIGLNKYRDMETYNHVQDCFVNLVLNTFNLHENHNFFVNRNDRKFIQAGRFQNEEESREIDEKLLTLMNHYKIPFSRIDDTTQIISALGLE